MLGHPTPEQPGLHVLMALGHPAPEQPGLPAPMEFSQLNPVQPGMHASEEPAQLQLPHQSTTALQSTSGILLTMNISGSGTLSGEMQDSFVEKVQLIKADPVFTPALEAAEVTRGSVQVNARLAAATQNEQAATSNVMVQQILKRLGATVSFAITIHLVTGSISKAAGADNKVLIAANMCPQLPVLLTAYVSDSAADTMIAEGHYLHNSRLWCSQYGQRTLEYLKTAFVEPNQASVSSELWQFASALSSTHGCG